MGSTNHKRTREVDSLVEVVAFSTFLPPISKVRLQVSTRTHRLRHLDRANQRLKQATWALAMFDEVPIPNEALDEDKAVEEGKF